MRWRGCDAHRVLDFLVTAGDPIRSRPGGHLKLAVVCRVVPDLDHLSNSGGGESRSAGSVQARRVRPELSARAHLAFQPFETPRTSADAYAVGPPLVLLTVRSTALARLPARREYTVSSASRLRLGVRACRRLGKTGASATSVDKAAPPTKTGRRRSPVQRSRRAFQRAGSTAYAALVKHPVDDYATSEMLHVAADGKWFSQQ